MGDLTDFIPALIELGSTGVIGGLAYLFIKMNVTTNDKQIENMTKAFNNTVEAIKEIADEIKENNKINTTMITKLDFVADQQEKIHARVNRIGEKQTVIHQIVDSKCKAKQ